MHDEQQPTTSEESAVEAHNEEEPPNIMLVEQIGHYYQDEFRRRLIRFKLKIAHKDGLTTPQIELALRRGFEKLLDHIKSYGNPETDFLSAYFQSDALIGEPPMP
ncbi:MAG: hypothetical protein GY816_20030 [Cytophagales bacterium]|nr:hypothetical protein [Cytophagales bacterium]